MIGRYLPGCANASVLILRLRLTKLAAVAAPDHYRKDFVRVGLVKIHERRLALAPRGVTSTDDLAAHRSFLSDVILCLGCGNMPGLCLGDRRDEQSEEN